MKQIYLRLWKLAKPYYQKGRPMDVDHIEWMMEEAEKVCKREGLDEEILMPLVMLHDVGYAEMPSGNPYELAMRKGHMAAGARIAQKLLQGIDYPADKAEKIVYFVSVHDNWALDDYEVYKKNKILWAFIDLDFIWMATPKGFPALMKIYAMNPQELIKYLENRRREQKMPFCCPTTKKLFSDYMVERKNSPKAPS